MKVISNNNLEMYTLPGLLHKTLSNKHNGGQEFEVWKQIIEGKSTTPVHKHDCDETIVVLRGEGECLCDGKRFQFSADQTLIFPANSVHQIINTGREELEILATLSMSPVIVKTQDGERIPLPWDADKSLGE